MRAPFASLPMLALILASPSSGQTPGGQAPSDRFFRVDSVAEALTGYLEFRHGAGMPSLPVEFCDHLVTEEILAQIRIRLAPSQWPDLSRTESCGRPARLDAGDVEYVLVVGPIGFTPDGATIGASRWHLWSQHPEVATVSRRWWRTTELRIVTPTYSDRIPRPPRQE